MSLYFGIISHSSECISISATPPAPLPRRAGYVAPNTGSIECTACAAGYYQPRAGMGECRRCEEGTSSAGGAASDEAGDCPLCGVDYFKMLPSSPTSECVLCEVRVRLRAWSLRGGPRPPKVHNCKHMYERWDSMVCDDVHQMHTYETRNDEPLGTISLSSGSLIRVANREHCCRVQIMLPGVSCPEHNTSLATVEVKPAYWRLTPQSTQVRA